MMFKENDYEVVTYRVLKYLYEVLKDEDKDVVPDVLRLHKILGKTVTDRYLGEILLGLDAEGYISGVEIEDEERSNEEGTFSVVLNEKSEEYIDFSTVNITWDGLEYLHKDSTMNEVRKVEIKPKGCALKLVICND